MHSLRRLFPALFAVVILLAPTTAAAQGGGACCVLPDNGGGSASLPPNCSVGYTGAGQIADGLMPAGNLQIAARLHSFFTVIEAPGGTLGGDRQTWNATLDLNLVGTGAWLGYNRLISLPATGETHSAPRMMAAPVQTFAMILWGLQAQTTTDPDFDLLRITGGNGFGLPSPGQTTLVSSGGGWAVDSFFDITYRVDFVGDVVGPFAGRSGSTSNSLENFDMCHQSPTPAAPTSWGGVKASYR